ncbi:uncharacterized protein LOC143919702 [Arctopsyche grandis]|uniref:uncharacterized protein LOC143919702 n=1 Tax=Arctopsyche grandis TaxID=121162 RepID=UPI00406D62ED
MDDADDVSETISESNLHQFIRCYETCEALWDPRNKFYLNRYKRNEHLNELLKIYKSIKSNATIEDVNYKLNSLRSNYRKELKKIDKAKRLGEVYIPISKTFHALVFLPKVNRADENPDPVAKHNEPMAKHNEPMTKRYQPMTKRYQPMTKRYQPMTKRNQPMTKRNQLLTKACTLMSQPTTSSQSPQKPVDLIVLVWSEKLKELSPTQRLYAEKAINNVLFEAQLNDLNRNSGQVNSFSPPSAPSTSYLCTPPPIIHIPENFNNNSNSNPTGIKIKKGLPSPIIIKRPRNNVATINALKFISKQCSVKNLFE